MFQTWSSSSVVFKHFNDLSLEMIHLSGTGNKADQAERDRLWDKEYSDSRAKIREIFDHIIQIQTQDAKLKSTSAVAEDQKKNLWTLVVVVFGTLKNA
jgi:hypothetical protein